MKNINNNFALCTFCSFKSALRKSVLSAFFAVLGMATFWSCGDKSTAGAVIDTNTLTAQIQGRSVLQIAGQWFIIHDQNGAIDSVAINTQGQIDVQYSVQNSLVLHTDSIQYFAYKIIATDTIRPSAPLRFLLPAYAAWDSTQQPWITHSDPLEWNSTHKVWYAPSIAPGRHLVQWLSHADTLSADLIIHEMANRFELHQMSPSIQSGSIRPLNCGFQNWVAKPSQKAGLACPHTESDAFNRQGISNADLHEWSDSVLRFTLTTLSNAELTPNPYSKMLLEFGPNEEPFDMSSFDTLVLHMNLPLGDSLHVRFAQSNQSVARWFSAALNGKGLTKYVIPLDTANLFNYYTKPLPFDLTQIFGLEFRNNVPGRIVNAQIYNVEWK